MVNPMNPDRFAGLEITSEQELLDWLARHHGQPESIWLVTWKACHPDRHVGRETVLDALVAYGWIDGRRMKLDEARTMQLISPRKQQVWAESYKKRAARLDAEGRMHPAGRAAVIAGQQSGKWNDSQPIDALIDPADLTESLAAHDAVDWWRASAPSYRRNILRWIAGAKQPQTRAKRIAITTAHAARAEKVPHY